MASSSSASRIDPELVISHRFLEQESFSYSERDAAIYALGVGACAGMRLTRKSSSTFTIGMVSNPLKYGSFIFP
ncbi:hypothetical protein IEQ34_000390 [Dendrobium chrysotoxum]|uniref:Uncharacterized protein n=1 Tax=Dendrobium chrysotoxum TaxID=161865 RepID=A0AAV7HPG9_DENCH|nr:hypothetical protein IEQ34_000390 [Dendrobium chrysotoxum]